MTTRTSASVMIGLAVFAAGCYQGAQPDPNPPSVYILKWERNPNGSQGAQTQVLPGGQFNVSENWLGDNQASIRVYGKGTYGVKKFTVSGTATGKASTHPNAQSQFFTAPGVLSTSFPAHVETAPAGTTRSFMVLGLGPALLVDRSCGHHSYQGAPPNAEYFLHAPATWTITATAENASGLQTTGTFTIKLE